MEEKTFHEKITSLHANDPSDPFDRQKGISKWDQKVLEQQTALVLGVGGLGCTVAFALARLGVGC